MTKEVKVSLIKTSIVMVLAILVLIASKIIAL